MQAMMFPSLVSLNSSTGGRRPGPAIGDQKACLSRAGGQADGAGRSLRGGLFPLISPQVTDAAAEITQGCR